jgi:hypothetical protein
MDGGLVDDFELNENSPMGWIVANQAIQRNLLSDSSAQCFLSNS